MLTDKDKMDIINDRVSSIENYMLELRQSLDKNEIHRDQIRYINAIILDCEASLEALRPLLQQLDLNAII